MEDLFEALHSMYNSANDRPVDLSALDPLPQMEERDWVPFSELEYTEALAKCASNSAPGPDHIKWPHLKLISKAPEVVRVFVALANGCMEVGHWPAHFKDSLSVIIPKPGKLSYSAP